MATTPPDASTGKQPFFNPNNVKSVFEESNKWLLPYFDTIDEYERIARNKPKDGIPAEYPKLTDGTVAALTQENPKRVIQQLATGLVEDKDYPAYARIADMVHTNILIPNSRYMGTELQKHWNMQSKAIVWGRSASYSFLTQENNQFYVDYSIPYVKDIITEKGKVYAPDSNYVFMRAWYSKADIQAIINREKNWQKADKSYTSDWDLTSLADLLNQDQESTKPTNLQTPSEKERGVSSGGIEIIHAFQKGLGAEFYSFSPRYEDGKVLRTKVNKDPRGALPIDFEYCNIDLSNPLGRGMVELAGPIQNLMDQKLQMHSYMSTLLMAPPLQVYGNVNKGTLKYRPNAIWDLGNNPNNLVKPLDINNNAIQSFVSEMQFLQSKIYNLFASQDNSIPSEDGNIGQSKTSAGVKNQAARVGVADNYFLKQHEAWYEAVSETRLNIMFAEMKMPVKMQLSGEDLKEIMESPAAQYVDSQGVLTVPFDKIKDISFKFQVDASSSEVKEDQDNAQKLTEVLQLMSQDPDPQVQAEKKKVYKLIINEIGAEGTDDLFKQETDENGQPIEQQPQGPDPQMIQQMVAQMVQQAMAEQKSQAKTISESIKWTPQDLTPAERAQALEQGGIQPDESGESTPNEIDQAHTQAIDEEQTAHTHALALQNAAQSQAQARDSQQQSQAQFDATQQANKESQIMQMLQQREQAQQKPAGGVQ